MRSPADMKIIQIDITNACVHTCSNCTRLCGNHKTPFFMDETTFKKAVDSLESYHGIIGIMGGEPTLHPRFADYALYLSEKHPRERTEEHLIAPTNDFMTEVELEKRSIRYFPKGSFGYNYHVDGPGLWSSLSETYHNNHELIQDIFAHQNINDHSIGCYHQPVMVTRKDMKISDDEWIPLRDNCWVQNIWSATITPKGAFFCEVAAALDMLLDGPGGWEIEHGWWKRRPSEFGDQLQWCEWCGLALKTMSRDANEGIDDVSPSFYEKLKEIGSPKIKKGLIHVYTKDEELDESKVRRSKYEDDEYNRVAKGKSPIYPKGFVCAINSYEAKKQQIMESVESVAQDFDKIIVFGGGDDVIKSMANTNVVVVKNDVYGQCLNVIHSIAGSDQYIVLIDAGIRLDSQFVKRMKSYVINPGTLHEYVVGSAETSSLIQADSYGKQFALYHTSAYALKRAGYDTIKLCESYKQFHKLWPERKRIHFTDNVLDGTEREKRTTIRPHMRYAVYGAGGIGKKTLSMVNEIGSEVVFFCDSNALRWGGNYCGKEVVSPFEMIKRAEEWDYIVIGTLMYREVKEVLIDLGIDEKQVVAPLFFYGDDRK